MERAKDIFKVVQTIKESHIKFLDNEKEIALQILKLLGENNLKVARANVILDACKEIIQYSKVGDFEIKV